MKSAAYIVKENKWTVNKVKQQSELNEECKKMFWENPTIWLYLLERDFCLSTDKSNMIGQSEESASIIEEAMKIYVIDGKNSSEKEIAERARYLYETINS